MFVPWLTYACAMPHSCVPKLIHVCAMTCLIHSCVYQDVLMCVTLGVSYWCSAKATHRHTCTHERKHTHSHTLHSVIWPLWLIYVCVSHDALIRVTLDVSCWREKGHTHKHTHTHTHTNAHTHIRACKVRANARTHIHTHTHTHTHTLSLSLRNVIWLIHVYAMRHWYVWL